VAEAVLRKWTVKKKYVYNTMFLIFTVTSIVFGLLFFTQTEISSIPDIIDPNGPPTFNRVIYGGFGDEAFNKPMDVALIGEFIYVTDTRNKRVQVFDLGGSQIFRFGKEGEGRGEFHFPYGIAGDSQGNVYVADLYNGGISVHDNKGKFIKYFAEKNPRENLIDTPGGLRIYNDKVYVTDIRKSRVYVFDLAGKKLLEIGKMGTKPGEFRAPNAVTVDKEGNIYVVDTGNHRVQVFDKNGKFLRIINGSQDGKGTSAFVNPRGIGIDSRGIIYVVSNLTHYLYGFDKNGKQLFVFGGSGGANDRFSLPNGLYISENDELFITDTANQRVVVYD
jgi:DNA-binding beta-propeller fold protein YncE